MNDLLENHWLISYWQRRRRGLVAPVRFNQTTVSERSIHLSCRVLSDARRSGSSADKQNQGNLQLRQEGRRRRH